MKTDRKKAGRKLRNTDTREERERIKRRKVSKEQGNLRESAGPGGKSYGKDGEKETK